MPAEAVLDVIRGSRRAATVLRPARLKLLQNLAQPDSASGLARKLSLPRQRVNYHLRELEKAGFVELVEERRRGNCVERVVRATATSYVISPEVLGGLGGGAEETRDRFSASYLIALAARVIREVATLRSRADRARKRLATLSLEAEIRFVSPRDRGRFAEELAAAVAGLVAKYHDAGAPGGRTSRIVIAGYPKPGGRMRNRQAPRTKEREESRNDRHERPQVRTDPRNRRSPAGGLEGPDGGRRDRAVVRA